MQVRILRGQCPKMQRMQKPLSVEFSCLPQISRSFSYLPSSSGPVKENLEIPMPEFLRRGREDTEPELKPSDPKLLNAQSPLPGQESPEKRSESFSVQILDLRGSGFVF